MAFRYC